MNILPKSQNDFGDLGSIEMSSVGLIQNPPNLQRIPSNQVQQPGQEGIRIRVIPGSLELL